MDISENTGELFTALSKFQGECGNVFKGSKGHGYSYADLGSILDMVKPLLASNGLSVVQLPSGSEAGQVGIETLLAHSSGQWVKQGYSIPIPDNKRNSAAQNAGSAITYARRYALAAALGIAQTDDDAALIATPDVEKYMNADNDARNKIWPTLDKPTQQAIIERCQ